MNLWMVMKMAENKIEKMLEIARSYIGTVEGSAKFREIIQKYNAVAETCGEYIMTYSDPWCAAFASMCSAYAGVDLPFSASVPRMIAAARKAGTWNKTPEIGDYITFDWNGDGTGDHVGIISSVSGSNISYIEGNANNRVQASVMNRGNTSILGYIKPGNEQPPEPQPTPEPPAPGELPTVKYDEISPAVKAMQSLLVLRGYSVGRWGIDGEFGPDTLAAVQRATLERLGTSYDYCPPALFVSLINS